MLLCVVLTHCGLKVFFKPCNVFSGTQCLSLGLKQTLLNTFYCAAKTIPRLRAKKSVIKNCKNPVGGCNLWTHQKNITNATKYEKNKMPVDPSFVLPGERSSAEFIKFLLSENLLAKP